MFVGSWYWLISKMEIFKIVKLMANRQHWFFYTLPDKVTCIFGTAGKVIREGHMGPKCTLGQQLSIDAQA